jgi:hypothetical protein
MLPHTKYLEGITGTAWSFPLAARVIHYGADDCHRLMVLRSAGYSVEDCRSLVQLRDRLARGAPADALLLSDAEGEEPNEAIALARTQSAAPVILFRSTTLAYEDTGVDLIVHSLTPPEVWLPDVDALIEKCRASRAKSEALIQKSAQMRHESAPAREHFPAERGRSSREPERNARASAIGTLLPKSGGE